MRRTLAGDCCESKRGAACMGYSKKNIFVSSYILPVCLLSVGKKETSNSHVNNFAIHVPCKNNGIALPIERFPNDLPGPLPPPSLQKKAHHPLHLAQKFAPNVGPFSPTPCRGVPIKNLSFLCGKNISVHDCKTRGHN